MEIIKERQRLGAIIKEFRKEKHLTQEQLAEKTGIVRTTISKIEEGKYNFGIDNYFILLSEMGVKIYFK